MTESVPRHLSPESFAGYLRTAAPIEHPVPGDPPLSLFVDPQHIRIGLRGPARPDETATATGRERVNVRLVHHHGHRMVEVIVTDARLFEDAYPVLCAVADRVQLDGRSMTQAVTQTLRQLGHLLEPEVGLSREMETSLLGELALLLGSIRADGPATAVEAWRGWDREEHDFGLVDCDVEVKTTTSERRAHRISSLTQLLPTADRPLWLVSFQVTKAGASGTTVAQLVERARTLVTEDNVRARLDTHLHAAGWRERYEHAALDTWRLRFDLGTYKVVEAFPQLTPGLLERAGVSTSHIDDVTYRIDLTTQTPDQPPATLAAIVIFAGKELP